MSIAHLRWPGDCSQQQLQTLDQFREHVKKMGLNTDVFDDAYLLRFLRARKFNLEKTIKMWTDFIDWRVKNNVDNIWVRWCFDSEVGKAARDPDSQKMLSSWLPQGRQAGIGISYGSLGPFISNESAS